MQVSDKLIRPLTEAKYLNADNVSRYRCIMRIFFEHYEKLKYWLYQEEVYEEMIQDPFFADYRMEQCGDRTSGHPVREFVYRRCIIRADPFGTYPKKCGAVPGDGRKR